MTRFKYQLGSVWNGFRGSSYQSIICLVLRYVLRTQILTMTLSEWEVFSKRICKFRQRMVPFDWNKSRCFRCFLHKWVETHKLTYKSVIGTFAEIKTQLQFFYSVPIKVQNGFDLNIKVLLKSQSTLENVKQQQQGTYSISLQWICSGSKSSLSLNFHHAVYTWSKVGRSVE